MRFQVKIIIQLLSSFFLFFKMIKQMKMLIKLLLWANQSCIFFIINFSCIWYAWNGFVGRINKKWICWKEVVPPPLTIEIIYDYIYLCHFLWKVRKKKVVLAIKILHDQVVYGHIVVFLLELLVGVDEYFFPENIKKNHIELFIINTSLYRWSSNARLLDKRQTYFNFMIQGCGIN